jgi:hypothetical protein
MTWPPRRRPRLPLALAVLAFHGLVLLAFLQWARHAPPAQRAVPRMRLTVVNLAPLPQAVPAPISPQVPPSPPAPQPAHASVMRSTTPRIGTGRPAPAQAPPQTIETAAAASAPAPAASAVAEQPSLLDTDATRRAIRVAAHQRGLGTQSSDQIGARAPTAAQALPGAIQKAGKGDCLKGNYPGGGMGLLSIPFFIAAEASGNCPQ